MAKKEQSVLTWTEIRDPRLELRRLADSMGEDECKILVRVARRLKFGEMRYGALSIKTDKRDFAKEAAEEALDFLVYLESYEEKKAGRRRKKATARGYVAMTHAAPARPSARKR